jgi:methanogenic corrinoid protein MtbC1
MDHLLEQIATCTEHGKSSRATLYPVALRGQDGVVELVAAAVAQGIAATAILESGLIEGMRRIGDRFSRDEVFVPEMLMAAKAMEAGLARLEPCFTTTDDWSRGTLVIATVEGDLHDIGKNLVGMIVRGGGWDVVDLGVDARTEDFLEAVESNPGCVVGLSALLTTTMPNMAKTVAAIKRLSAQTRVLVGGAPVTQAFCAEIGADCYGEDPAAAMDFLASVQRC